MRRSVLGAAVAIGMFLASPASAVGQASVVETRRTVISTDVDTDVVEPWLAFSPADPRVMLATAMFPDTDSSAVYRTEDGGTTWARTGVGGEAFPGGDPILTFGPEGEAYVGMITPSFLVWRSSDGGRTWSEPVELQGGSADRQWLAVDGTNGPRRGRVYAATKIWIRVFDSPAQSVMALTSSADGGATFRPPELLLPRPDREFLHVVNGLGVSRDGRTLAVFSTLDPGRSGDGVLRGRFELLVSDDGGRHWGEPIDVAPMRMYPNSRGEVAMKGLGAGSFAVGPSPGGGGERLYFGWTEPLEDRLHVMLVASDDGGRTWTDPVQIDDGRAESNQSNVGVAVAGNGTVAVVWNDRRDDPDDRCFAPYMAVSHDGGRTFSPNQRLGTGRTCPRGGRWVGGGDTQGIVGLPDGSFQLAWIDGADGVMRLVSSAVRTETAR